MTSLEERNGALMKVIDSLLENRQKILEMNKIDVNNAREKGMKEGLVDRLYLDDKRLADIADNIHSIVKLDDPIWNSSKVFTRPNGLTIAKMTVPIGVIGIIYESRPNVTVDAFSLAIKSGNTILLKGSSSSINTNIEIVKAIKSGLRKSSITENVVFFIEDERREVADEMMNLTGVLDLLIPRGGKELINYVVEHSKVPTLKNWRRQLPYFCR
jgi:glutamate-5-semialdehyde dehydrogenase (EC 1.2.1.41)